MPNYEQHFSAPTSQHESDALPERIASDATRREAGKRVLFRVMNLDDHSGVRSRAEDGAVTYTVDNQQYPDQGDFAFGHEATGFQDATTRAYPRNLHNVHAVEVDAAHVVEPYPDDAPAKHAQYKEIPAVSGGDFARYLLISRTLVNNYNGREKNAPVEPIVEALHQLLMNYPKLKRRRDKIQSLLSCLVKPDGFTEISYIG